MGITTNIDDRVISLGAGLPAIPERLLLAHARGEVLFITGAGISKPEPANLPDFRDLVLEVYKILDPVTHGVLIKIPPSAHNQWSIDSDNLTNQQTAEVKRFISKDYDVVLGMLERRIDGHSDNNNSVRQAIRKILHSQNNKPASIHRSLMRLADRGGAATIITTNFDLLLQEAAKNIRMKVQTYSLGGIPRPSKNIDFSGIMHIHGALDRNPERLSELIISDQDFGEFYLRRRVVPDFIYDAARLYHLVLVGYSANDPPMRYLLNAVAADGSRFSDLKERFAFVGTSEPDHVNIEDWRGRGITPIHYDAPDGDHSALYNSLQHWANFSAINGNKKRLNARIKKIVKTNYVEAPVNEKDLFDHFFRRSNAKERTHLSKFISNHRADIGWLGAIKGIMSEHNQEQRK